MANYSWGSFAKLAFIQRFEILLDDDDLLQIEIDRLQIQEKQAQQDGQQSIEQEFFVRMIDKTVNSVDDFFKKSVKDVDKAVKISKSRSVLDGIEQSLRQTGMVQLCQVSPLQSLEQFVQQNQLDDTQFVDDQFFMRHGYFELVTLVFKMLVRREYSKKHVIWIQGKANTGKSTFMRMIEKIFLTQRLQETSSNFSLKIQNEFKPQVILMDEFNQEHFFNKKFVAKIKRFFEGQGLVIECKYKDPQLSFIGVPVIMSTNTIDKSKFCYEDWQAIERRVEIVILDVQSNDEQQQFPFTVEQLAYYYYLGFIVKEDDDK